MSLFPREGTAHLMAIEVEPGSVLGVTFPRALTGAYGCRLGLVIVI